MTAKEKLESEYLTAYCRAISALRSVDNAIHNLPAPENDESPATWGNVGDMLRIAAHLEDLLPE